MSIELDDANDPDDIRYLESLANSTVWVSIARAHAQEGSAILRRGILKWREKPAGAIGNNRVYPGRLIAEVVDDSDVPMVKVLSSESIRRWNDVLRCERRLGFTVDLSPTQPALNHETPASSYLQACRNIAAETEACLREGVIFDPDPHPKASWRALYEKQFGLPRALVDSEDLHISANSQSAIVRATAEGTLSATFFASIARNGAPTIIILRSRSNPTYDLDDVGQARLGGDLRALFYRQLDGFERVAADP